MARLKAAGFSETIHLCLPAVLVAILLRAILLACMPAAFVHNDTASIVETADKLLSNGRFAIDGKKTFLVPIAYSIPALAGLPILPFVAVVQHLLGVAAVFICGLLARLWFRNWRALIVPLTMLVALQPVLLWYEHTALAEAWAVFGALLVALAASAFRRIPNRYTFAFLLAAMFFMAGARPEGRLFALFALVLVTATLWGNWRTFRVAVPVTVTWTAILFLLTRTGQSGLLLFTSVLHLTPDRLFLSPGVAEATASLAADARAQWASDIRAPKLVPLRKALRDTIVEMQIASGTQQDVASKNVNRIASRAGLETAARAPLALPGLALEKFVIAHREPPAPSFNEYAIAGQMDALYDWDSTDKAAVPLSPLLWNRGIESPEEATAFLTETYRPYPVDLATRVQDFWLRVSLLPALPWNLPGASIEDVPVRGVPWLYLAAFLGMLALAVGDPTPLGFHRIWGLFLIGLFILIMVTANIRARFRVLFEPFWLLYAFALFDTVIILVSRFLPRRSRTS